MIINTLEKSCSILKNSCSIIWKVALFFVYLGISNLKQQ